MPPEAGGSSPRNVVVTGTIIGIVLGIAVLVGIGVAIWFAISHRSHSSESQAGVEYETDLESGPTAFEPEAEYGTFDGGEASDVDELAFTAGSDPFFEIGMDEAEGFSV